MTMTTTELNEENEEQYQQFLDLHHWEIWSKLAVFVILIISTLRHQYRNPTTQREGRRNGYSRYSDCCTEYNPNFVGIGEIFLLCRSYEDSRRVLKLLFLFQIDEGE